MNNLSEEMQTLSQIVSNFHQPLNLFNWPRVQYEYIKCKSQHTLLPRPHTVLNSISHTAACTHTPDRLMPEAQSGETMHLFIHSLAGRGFVSVCVCACACACACIYIWETHQREAEECDSALKREEEEDSRERFSVLSETLHVHRVNHWQIKTTRV